MKLVLQGAAALAIVLVLGGCTTAETPKYQLQIKEDAVRPKARTKYAESRGDAAPVRWSVTELSGS